jgi:hypothetical protein
MRVLAQIYTWNVRKYPRMAASWGAGRAHEVDEKPAGARKPLIFDNYIIWSNIWTVIRRIDLFVACCAGYS